MTIAITQQTHRLQSAGLSIAELATTQQTKLADDARSTVAAHCDNTAQLQELALMLGLLEVDPDTGSLVKTTPWDADLGGSLPRSPSS